jgi:hypothetical protein
LKLKFEIDKDLFNETSIKPLPSDFDFKISFPIQKPDGSLHLRFTNGKNKEIDSIILGNSSAVIMKRSQKIEILLLSG